MSIRRTTSVLATLVIASLAWADDKKPSYPQPPSAKDVKITPDAWKTAPRQRLTANELDALIASDQKADKLAPSPVISDEQFIRRVTLDLTGKLPLPADVEEFVASQATNKRSQLIDKLLASDEFARHWAKYWHDVIVSRATDMRIKRQALTRAFEEWLAGEMKEKHNWGQMAREMITASGEMKYNGEGNAENGAAIFLLCHQGQEAAVERAAETSRVFMGIQIQCAQCHDHPSDIWKRNQFHELTAFYARLRERPIRNANGQGFQGIELFSPPRGGEHQMPGLDDPKKTTLMHPRFLTGERLTPSQSDAERRKALAAYVTDKNNYWFSAAFVNRTWGELMGQGFYNPVDNMGPLQQATYPTVLVRLAAHFRATDYDIRELYRVVMNSNTYQRQMRLGDTTNEHLHFAGSYPKKLSATSLWESLNNVLGQLQGGAGPRPQGPQARFAGRLGVQGQFMDVFEFDPSTKADEVEGSVPQALMLMNNPAINGKIRAGSDTILGKILHAYPDDAEAIKMVYLRTLARKPTAHELATCREYVASVGNRGEAFEDLLWSLINSTEFQTKR
jgi:hypothetical protein